MSLIKLIRKCWNTQSIYVIKNTRFTGTLLYMNHDLPHTTGPRVDLFQCTQGNFEIATVRVTVVTATFVQPKLVPKILPVLSL